MYSPILFDNIQTMNISSPKNQFQYAGLGQRFVALVIDFIILSIVFFPLTKLVKGVWIMSVDQHLWNRGYFITDPLCIIFLVVIFLYFVLSEGFWGATIGKKLIGLHVVGVDGHNSGLKQAFIRNILRVVDSLPAFNILGIVLILGSPERARFGDRVAGTRVIVKKKAR